VKILTKTRGVLLSLAQCYAILIAVFMLMAGLHYLDYGNLGVFRWQRFVMFCIGTSVIVLLQPNKFTNGIFAKSGDNSKDMT